MTNRVGLGKAFQPIAGGQIVRAGVDVRDGVARVPAYPGSPVHAVVDGTVGDSARHDALELRAADGRRFNYVGLAPGSVTVAPGTVVAAGDILGLLEGRLLELRITDLRGETVRADDAMLGLTDPNELGYIPVGVGLGVDPDHIDRQIVPG
jgi:hypothetical protein